MYSLLDAKKSCTQKGFVVNLRSSWNTSIYITMKKLLATLAVVAISAGYVNAGCGKKVASIGTLTSYDAKTKTLTMKVQRTNDPKANKKATKLTLTPASKVIGDATLDKLVGKALSVVSEHGRVDLAIPLIAANRKK